MADGEKLVCTGVSLVVREIITITSLLRTRTSGDDVDRHTPRHESRDCVELLHERGWFHQARPISSDESEFACRLAECGADENRIGLVTTEGDEHRIDACIFSVFAEVGPARNVRTWR